ncbi:MULTISPECIES: hypothetical protein [Citrobacter]|uniref:Uncharacterized protein n=1 Tax=Citrobacter telavivensis TaxID=2653932 RepID=A0A6L5E1N6_9ENTR|nr:MULTISPECIES: hypothetical protein [Citrobacter]MPQ49324.1 hypothetical protein [Citrobacter telavivensis]QFS72435.1 hypothetical protein GBC03_20640 [Citrobacter telavivensis]CAI9389653.1 hypothetical protein CITSP_03300 [Citrobacter sp. T1.2D-1]
MGLQLIIKAERNKIEKALGSLTSECEIFPVAEGFFGISIPERSLLSAGEAAVLKKLEPLARFDLWQGAWQEPKRRWLW